MSVSVALRTVEARRTTDPAALARLGRDRSPKVLEALVQRWSDHRDLPRAALLGIIGSGRHEPTTSLLAEGIPVDVQVAALRLVPTHLLEQPSAELVSAVTRASASDPFLAMLLHLHSGTVTADIVADALTHDPVATLDALVWRPLPDSVWEDTDFGEVLVDAAWVSAEAKVESPQAARWLVACQARVGVEAVASWAALGGDAPTATDALTQVCRWPDALGAARGAHRLWDAIGGATLPRVAAQALSARGTTAVLVRRDGVDTLTAYPDRIVGVMHHRDGRGGNDTVERFLPTGSRTRVRCLVRHRDDVVETEWPVLLRPAVIIVNGRHLVVGPSSVVELTSTEVLALTMSTVQCG